jgi:hypothetical protein
MSERSHSVTKLWVHPPDNQVVRFLQGQHTQVAEAGKETTAWFCLNQTSTRLIAKGCVLDSLQFTYLMSFIYE